MNEFRRLTRFLQVTRLVIVATAVLGALCAGRVLAFEPLVGTPLVVSPSDQSWPRISGNLVAWQDGPLLRNSERPVANIFAMDLASGQTYQLTTSQRAARPAVSGSVVVWTEIRGDDRDIYGFDFATGQSLSIVTARGPQDHADISGPLVVWVDGREQNFDLYGLDLRTGQEFKVISGPGPRERPRVSGSTVVWREGRVTAGFTDIFAINLESGQEIQVTNTHFASQPAIDGDWVVYVEGYLSSPWIHAYNLRSGETRRLSTSNTGRRGAPVITGGLVVWQDAHENTWDIWGYDLNLGREMQLVVAAGDQTEPSSDGVNLVWTDTRGAGHDLYWADVPRLES